MSTLFIENTTVEENGNIPLSKEIRNLPGRNGLGSGVDVTVFFDGKQMVVMDSALYALKQIQEEMKGMAEKAGFRSEEELDAYVLESPRQ